MPEPINQSFQLLNGKYFAPDHRSGGNGLGVMSIPKDPIMAATDVYKADSRADKVTLAIGVCTNESGQLEVPERIQNLMREVNVPELLSGNYLPGEGDEFFLKGASALIFGQNISKNNICSVQTIGGTNALYLAMAVADYAKFEDSQIFANCPIHIPQATWGNHLTIAHLAGFKTEGIRDPKNDPRIQRYPYLSSDGKSIEADALLSYIDNINESSMIILHASCMNFCGIDPSKNLWGEILDKILEKQNQGIMLIPIFDCAYQGFGKGKDEDVYPIRIAAKKGVRFFVAESYSKKFGLYRYRTGATHYYSPDSDESAAMKTNLVNIQRGTNSSCPIAGAYYAKEIMAFGWMPKIEAFWEDKRKKFGKAREALADVFQDPTIEDRLGMFVTIPGLDHLRLWEEQAIQTVPVSWRDKDGKLCQGTRICIDPIGEMLNHKHLMERIKAVL